MRTGYKVVLYLNGISAPSTPRKLMAVILGVARGGRLPEEQKTTL